MMTKSKAASLLSLLPKLTVAEVVAAVVGLKAILKVVVPPLIATGLVGCWVTLKSVAGDTLTKFGPPERVSAASPLLAMV